MSDEVSSAPAEAPVAEAPASIEAAPEASGTNSSSDGPVSEASSPASEATASAPSVEGEVTSSPYDSYDWDGWDGNHESWPEEFRGWGSKLHGRLENERKDIESLRSLYDQLLSGAQDPRVGELTGEINGYKEKISAFEAQLAEAKAQHDTLQQSMQEYHTKEAEDFAARFVRDHEDVFKDKEKSARFEALLDQDWSPDDAVKVSRLQETSYNLVKEAVKEGTPVHRAVELAELREQLSAPQPRAGAKLTSGASRRAVPNQTKNIERRKPSSFTDIRNYAVEKAFAKQRK